MCRLLIAALVSFASVAQADALAELKMALTRLGGRQTLAATVELSRSRHSKGRFLNDDFEGTARFDVEMNAAGLRASFPRGLIDRADDEDWTRQMNPDRSAPTYETLVEATPQAIEKAFDFSRPLLRLIARGAVVEQRVEPWQGRAARVVVLRLPLQAATSREPSAMTVHEDMLTVWIDADGTPMLTRRVRKGTAGIFLIHVDTTRTESATYAIRGDHLVVMRLDDSAVVSGPGQHGTAKSVWTLRDVSVSP